MSDVSVVHACLPLGDARMLASLRTLGHVEVLFTEAFLWLRAFRADARIVRALRTIPGCELFEVHDGTRLAHPGRRIPHTRVPEGIWNPIEAVFALDCPETKLPGRPGRVALRLVRSSEARTPALLVTRVDLLDRYVSCTPSFRCAGVRFAITLDDQVWVHGHPLPAVQGRLHVLEHDVAWPSGHTFDPALEPAAIARAVRLRAGEFALFDVDGAMRLARWDAFQLLTRAAWRATRGEAT